MMRIISNITEYLICYVKRRTFLLSIILYLIFIIFRAFGEMNLPFNRDKIGVYYFFDSIYALGGTKLILLFICTFPVVTIFVNDWNSGRILNILTRQSILKYCITLILTSAIISILIPIIANIIYFIILSFKFSLFNFSSEKVINNFIGYKMFFNHDIKYYLFLFFTKSAVFSFYCILSVTASIIFTNYYTTFILPLFLYTVLGSFVNRFPILFFIQTQNVFSMYRVFYKGMNHFFNIDISHAFEVCYPFIYYLVFILFNILLSYALLKIRLMKESSFGGGINIG